jgi:hypothetical protein
MEKQKMGVIKMLCFKLFGKPVPELCWKNIDSSFPKWMQELADKSGDQFGEEHRGQIPYLGFN